MRRGSRHAQAPGLRPRNFASPQTSDVRWLPIHRHVLSSRHQWRDPSGYRLRTVTVGSYSRISIFHPKDVNSAEATLSVPLEVMTNGVDVANAHLFVNRSEIKTG